MENQKIFNIRHSLSHLLAGAVLSFYPDAKLAIGPAIDNGFYYDFEFSTPISDKDLGKIEQKMKELMKKWSTFEKKEISLDEARKLFTDQPYKLELIADLEKENTKPTIYVSGDFTDLCAGPHVTTTKEIPSSAFKLERIAGAYWRGDEKNKMLTRIYGLAFETKEKLEEYLKLLEEAQKRDHKKIGKELELFMFHETAPGMPYWLTKGLIIYNELVNYWRIKHSALGYQEICSPLVNKSDLWKISGHWDHYKDDMFIADMGENEVYGIKPMNCPNAMLVYKSKPRSYRELPLRLSDTDRLHRYERSGTLNGLLRCRSFQQDDAHNFVTEDMIGSEYESIFAICKEFYGIFNLEYSFRLGTRPLTSFLGDVETWDKAEAALKGILENSGKKYIISEGDGAFYGPKIDILMKDALGRDWQMGTIQLDFQLPRRFELEYTDSDGKKKTPVVIHRVIYGSLERFLGVFIEHCEGNFPLWLSPTQIKIIPVRENHNEYAKKIADELIALNIRVDFDDTDEGMGKKIRAGKVNKVPYMLVIGDKEIESGELALEIRDGATQTKITPEDLKVKLVKEIKERI